MFSIVVMGASLKTAAGVAAGNKLFGAAILRKSDLSVVVAETNNEMENPLWHGEMHALKRFYELPAAMRPATSASKSVVCTMVGCTAAIVLITVRTLPKRPRGAPPAWTTAPAA